MKRREHGEESLIVARRDTLRDWLEERLAPLPELELRRLFSGLGLYSADTIFGICFQARVFLKVDDTTVDDFVTRGAEPFCPRPGQRLGRYYEVPADVLDDDDQLLDWARRAIIAASHAPPRRERTPAATRQKRAAKARPSSAGTPERLAKKRAAGKKTPTTKKRMRRT